MTQQRLHECDRVQYIVLYGRIPKTRIAWKVVSGETGIFYVQLSFLLWLVTALGDPDYSFYCRFGVMGPFHSD